jgi:hypothetical protein
LGADVGYLSPSLTPGDQPSDTATPFYDRYIRAKENKESAPAAAPAAAPTAASAPREVPFSSMPRTPEQKAENARLAAIRESQLKAAAAPVAAAVAPPAAAAKVAAPARSADNTGIKAVAPTTLDPAVAARLQPSPDDGAMYDPGGIMATPAVGADGKPIFRGPNAAIQKAAYEADQEANIPIEDRLKKIESMQPENAAAAEYRKRIMDERANSKEENERQRQMRLAQFFAKWGSTPGATLAAGLIALEKSLPDMISDEANFKKAKRELDKVMFDIDNATRLEKLGNIKEARSEKEKAAETAMRLNQTLAQAMSSENTARIQSDSSKYSTDANVRIAQLREQSAALDRSANRATADDNKKFSQFQSASQQEILVNNRIAAEENGRQHLADVKLINDAKLMKPADMPEGYADKIAAARGRIGTRETNWNTQLETAKKNTERAYARVSGGEPAAPAAATDKPITKAEFDKLPSGARFTAPDGSIRTKP